MESNVSEQNTPAQPRTLLTVNQFADKHPAFSVGGLRWQIFNSAINGLDVSYSIVRLGKRVLIDEEKYFQWIDGQQERRSA
jgi:hypothetical protein